MKIGPILFQVASGDISKEEADVIVTYITHTRSGAYMTYDYAKQKGKKILNYGGAEL